jgi:hypothetical protein
LAAGLYRVGQVFVTPVLGDSSQATAGDERWYCLDYPLLNDKQLLPLLDHPNLNDKVKPSSCAVR